MPPADDIWEVMSTARTIRRFTDEPVDDAVLTRCLEAATWAPNGANAQAWRFVVLRTPEQRAVVAEAARRARAVRSEEHTSELQSLMRISYAGFCLKKKKPTDSERTRQTNILTHNQDCAHSLPTD